MGDRSVKVLASIEWYSPAYRAGGIVSSLKNQVEHLKGTIDFHIVTGNADLAHPEPISDAVNRWVQRDGHRVWYANSTPDWSTIIGDVQPDLI